MWALLLGLCVYLATCQHALGQKSPTIDLQCWQSFWPLLTTQYVAAALVQLAEPLLESAGSEAAHLVRGRRCQARSVDNAVPDVSDDLADTLRSFIASCVEFRGQDQSPKVCTYKARVVGHIPACTQQRHRPQSPLDSGLLPFLEHGAIAR